MPPPGYGQPRRSLGINMLVPVLLMIALAPSAPSPSSAPETTAAGMFIAPKGSGDPTWVPLRKADGIVISTRPNTKATEDSVRAEMEVSRPPLVVASVMLDLSRATEWLSGLVDVTVVRTEDEEHYTLQARMASPSEQARDVILGTKLAVRPAPLQLEAELRQTSLEDIAETGTTRDPSMASVQLTSLNGGRRTAIRMTIVCGGPSGTRGWCADLAAPDWALGAISRFRTVLDKGNIEIPTRLKEVVEEASSPPIGNGPSYESALADNTETVTIGAAPAVPDLTQSELSAPLTAAAFIGDCGAPDDMKVVVRAAVRAGKAVGVTVRTEPTNRIVGSCIDRAVRRLRWKPNPKTDFVTTSY
jgi:hypothetical protein